MALLREKRPRVLWLVPGNPATRTGCSKDRLQSKLFRDAVEVARELGLLVVIEGFSNSPVWELPNYVALRETLHSHGSLWCRTGSPDPSLLVRRPTTLLASEELEVEQGPCTHPKHSAIPENFRHGKYPPHVVEGYIQMLRRVLDAVPRGA